MAFIYEDDIDNSKTKSPKNRFIYEDDAGMEDSVLNKSYGDFNWFSGDDWGDAVEGLGVATGITGDVNPEIKDMIEPGFGEDFTERGLHIATNVGSGLKNAAIGAAAGVAEFAGDAAGVMPSFVGGGNYGRDFLHNGADQIRKFIPEDSVGGAMGEELGYGAGAGGLLGRAISKIPAGLNQRVANAAQNFTDRSIAKFENIFKKRIDEEIAMISKNRSIPENIIRNHPPLMEQITKDVKNKLTDVRKKTEKTIEDPNIGVGLLVDPLIDIIGKVSPKIAKGSKNIIADVAGRVPAGRITEESAAKILQNKFKKKQLYGYGDESMDLAKEELLKPTSAFAKKVGTYTGAAIGGGVNAFDSVMEKALNNTERLNLPDGTIDNQDGTYTLPDHNGTIVRRKR